MATASRTLTKLIPVFGQSNVRIKDPQNVEKMIRKIIKDAHHKLQIIADFDWTLSKHSENGIICSTTHGVLRESQFVPEFYKEETERLKNIYLPIEFDVTLTEEEKVPKMIEWWTQINAVLIKSGLNKDILKKSVAHSKSRLRNGCSWLFDKLHELQLPILLFSAGLGDVIIEIINQQAKFYDANMKLVSNFLDFDDEGNMVGFLGDEVIHSLNKNENAIHSSDYFYNIRHRENILLLGDTIGDLHMAQGAENVENMLTIGFLNFKVEESLPKYMDNFDIVIIEDESLDVVNGIIKEIIAESDQDTAVDG